MLDDSHAVIIVVHVYLAGVHSSLAEQVELFYGFLECLGLVLLGLKIKGFILECCSYSRESATLFISLKFTLAWILCFSTLETWPHMI